jgi:hypothetical protein
MARHATIIDMMTTIRKTVDIPTDRHLSFDLPETVPVGKATMVLYLIEEDAPGSGKQTDKVAAPFPTMEELKAEAARKTAQRKAEGRSPFESLYGCLKDSPAFSGDPVELVKEWRDEWAIIRQDRICYP